MTAINSGSAYVFISVYFGWLFHLFIAVFTLQNYNKTARNNNIDLMALFVIQFQFRFHFYNHFFLASKKSNSAKIDNNNGGSKMDFTQTRDAICKSIKTHTRRTDSEEYGKKTARFVY